MSKLKLLFALLAGVASSPVMQAASVIPPEFPELVNGADYIVRARVSSVRTELQSRGGKAMPFTKVTLQVIEVIAGSPPSPLVLTMLGGRTLEGELTVEGAPKFTVGDEDILFIEGNGRNFSPLYAVMHGRYPIFRDKKSGREFVARANGVALAAVAEVALPMAEGKLAQRLRRQRLAEDALTTAEFVEAIKEARAAGRMEGMRHAK